MGKVQHEGGVGGGGYGWFFGPCQGVGGDVKNKNRFTSRGFSILLINRFTGTARKLLNGK